jgi:hypothetical protein
MGKIEGTGVEVNADQGEQSAGLPVASPENVVVPVGRFPSFAETLIGLAEHSDEPGFKPLAVLVKQQAGVIDVDIFDDLAQRSPQDQPCR